MAIQAGLLKSEEFKPLSTIGDLSKWRQRELVRLQNCGNKTLVEFEALLKNYGLPFNP
jgi:DNA-directed RNA polymerase alpha subunit